MPAACCITLRVFPGTVWSLPITGSLNTNGLVIAEVYNPGKSVYFTHALHLKNNIIPGTAARSIDGITFDSHELQGHSW